MKDHLPRVYWRDVPPEDSDLLARAGRSGESDGLQPGWTDFAPLADRMLGTLEDQIDPSAGGGDPGTRVGTLKGRTSEALRELEPPRALSIRERDEPEVGRLVAVNPYSSRSVLIPEGTVFLGGAQNRMTRGPHLIPPGVRELPVYCVEMGRWDMDETKFVGLTRLPGLLEHQISSAVARGVPDVQASVWELVYESLTMLGQLNPTLNVNGWRAETTAPDDEDTGSRAEAPEGETPPDRWRGTYALDPGTGLASLSLAPHDAFGGLSLKGLRRDLDWRGCLRRNARGAREFFRIFDEEKQLAIRCMPDGRPLRDMRKRPILFNYRSGDLEHSFRPPLDKPPAPPPLSFAAEPHFDDFGNFMDAIRASRARLTRQGQEDVMALELKHPELPLRGAGLVYKNELASLDVTAFRPFKRT